MIRLGYVKNGEDVLHETVNSVPESNDAMDSLIQSMADESVEYFYKERQTTDTDFEEWEKYAFIDQT
mgnify:CR=1 FL=1